jgi:hypothetical protein
VLPQPWFNTRMATLITDEGSHEVDGSLRLTAEQFRDATGWELKSEGLCRGDVCVVTHARPELRADGKIDVRVAAELLNRPLAVDGVTGDAALGESAAARAGEYTARALTDLVLYDVDGNAFEWKRIGRKKKVLAAWASW